jgi:hypothetical protein
LRRERRERKERILEREGERRKKMTDGTYN